MNKQKSGILVLRVDRRTPLPARFTSTNGIPVVSSYKYLGLLVDDCMDLKPLQASLKAKIRTLKYQVALTWGKQLPGKARLLAWYSLVRSRVVYGMFLICHFQPSLLKTLQSFFY